MIATSRKHGGTCRRQSSIVRFWPCSWPGLPWAEDRRWVEDRRWQCSFEMSTWYVNFHELHGIEKLTKPMHGSSAKSAKCCPSTGRASPRRVPRADANRRAPLPSINRTRGKSPSRREDQPSAQDGPTHKYPKGWLTHRPANDRSGTPRPSPSATRQVSCEGERPRQKEHCPKPHEQM